MNEFRCRVDSGGIRLDSYIANVLGLFSRSQIASRNLRAWIGGKPVKMSRKVREGDELRLEYEDPPPVSLDPEDIPLSIVYETNRMVVVDKPQGMVVHPGSGVHSGTLVQGLLYRYRDSLSSFGKDCLRPGIVHRLDKDTSGLIVAALDPEAHEFLQAQFRNRTVRKTYYAITKGLPSPSRGWIRTLIGRDPRDRKKFAVVARNGKQAVTSYRTVRSLGDYALVALSLHTGRTHQLRVHLSHIRSPILGDPVYSRKDRTFPDVGLCLHSARLRIVAPGGTDPMTFLAPIPERMETVLRILESRFRT